MLYYTIGQEYAFLECAFGGVVLGGLYETSRFAYRFLGGGRLVGMLTDLVSVVVCGAWIFTVLMNTNGGEMRWYVVLGFAFGYSIYRLGIHPPINAAISALSRYTSTAIRATLNTKIIRTLLK